MAPITLDDAPATSFPPADRRPRPRDDPGAAAAQCHAVLIDFLGAIDHGWATQALALFTPDASLDAHGTRHTGREEIAAFLTSREADSERHTANLVANEVVRRIDDHELEITAVLFLHERQPGGGYALQRVLDTVQIFRLTDQGWRIGATSPRHTRTTDAGAPAHGR